VKDKTNEITYFKLNNQINRPVNNQIPLQKDQEAVRAYFKEHVNPNTVPFESVSEKIDFLIEQDFIEEGFINKYSRTFIEQLFEELYQKEFRFRSFMGAYKFYTQYALKTDDGTHVIWSDLKTVSRSTRCT